MEEEEEEEEEENAHINVLTSRVHRNCDMHEGCSRGRFDPAHQIRYLRFHNTN